MKYRKSNTQDETVTNTLPSKRSSHRPSSSYQSSTTYQNIKLAYDKVKIVSDYPLVTCNCYRSCKNVSICCALFWLFILIFLNYGHYILCNYNVGMCFPFSEMFLF